MKYNFSTLPARENTNSVKYDLRGEIFGKKDIIPLWVADMDFPVPPPVKDALEERMSHPFYGYTFRSSEYYSSISDWIKKIHGWQIENDWICFSPGVVPALNFCTMAFTSPGDEIVVQPPVYFPFFAAITDHGREIIHNELTLENGKYRIDFKALRSQVTPKTKMFFLCNPHNPVGRSWTRDELKELGDFCLERDILLISDEIHSDLVLPGYKHTPMASISDDIAGITITCMAPSKTFNLAGFYTSSIIISNEELRSKFRKVTSSLHIEGGNIFGAVASEAAYRKGAEWREELLTYVNGNIEYLMDYCSTHLHPLKTIRPEATYMVWIDCRELGLGAEETASFFIEQAGVGLNQGSMFGPGGEGFMRINVACPRAVLTKALEQIRGALENLKK